MLRATLGLGIVGLIFYLSPAREPFGAETGAGMAEAAALGLRGALRDGGAEAALAGAALGRVLLENPRTPQRIIPLTRPGATAGSGP
jgi:hypothetical protein